MFSLIVSRILYFLSLIRVKLYTHYMLWKINWFLRRTVLEIQWENVCVCLLDCLGKFKVFRD